MSDPQKTKRLPRHVDPRKLAAQESCLQGPVPTADMARLTEAVFKPGDAGWASLKFRFDENRRTVIDGEFSLDVELACQRCLQAVPARLEGELHVGVVWDEDRAAGLPKRLDPWLVSTETADLYELLEDEFLLSLPIVAYHEKDSCPSQGTYSTGEFEEDRKNPFSVLARLKK